MNAVQKPITPSMGKYRHKFAKDLDDLVEDQEYTRYEMSQHKRCAFLQDGEFCCTNRKAQRGKLCEEHVAVLAAQNKAAPKKAPQATAKPKSSKRYSHARWDELPGANIAQDQLLTPDELFALRYCAFIDQGRFCCAQKLDAERGRLCADHQERVRREQEQRAEQRKKEQTEREQKRREMQKKREQAQLKQLANSVILAEGCPDTPEIRMRVARRILAHQ